MFERRFFKCFAVAVLAALSLLALARTDAFCEMKKVDWAKVENRWRDGRDELPGWNEKLSGQELACARSAGESINRFAFDLYQLVAAETEGNILFSPYNLCMTLMEEYRECGLERKLELKKALYLNNYSLINFRLLAKIVKATPEDRGEFYSFGECAYFKSDWEFPFYNHKELSTLGLCKANFYPDRDIKQIVNMMRQDQRAKYYEDEDIKSFEFPFVDRYYSYVIILPKMEWGLRQVEKALSYEGFQKLLSKQRDRNIEVRLIETKANSSYDFSHLLQRLGISEIQRHRQKNIFKLYGGEQSRAVQTDWSTIGIVGDNGLINFDGTPSRQIITQELLNQLYPSNVDRSFIPNRPFMYFIIDNRNNAILFIGRYTGPEQSAGVSCK